MIMADSERLKKKLQTALKFGGFNVRREFCSMFVDNFLNSGINLSSDDVFSNHVRKIVGSLESQCLLGHSIEKEHIDRALEACLHSGYDKNETIFNVINGFDVPKLLYNLDRKQYFVDPKKPKLLGGPDAKAQLFIERYLTVFQRTKRNFKENSNMDVQIDLQTVDFLLTVSHASLQRVLILGSLLQVSEGKFYLEDPTGLVQLDLTHCKYHGGFYMENSFVLVNGTYEDKLLKVSTMVLPPGEEYEHSRVRFGALNYFGGPSSTPLRDSTKLLDHMRKNSNDSLLFFSEMWLDHPATFEKLEVLFDGLSSSPPIAFVFMGKFLNDCYSKDRLENSQKLFKKLAELIGRYQKLVEGSNFVFIPNFEDPCPAHTVPRLPLSSTITNELTKVLNNRAIFGTNPCRIQYCTREIVVFRADMVPKLLQGTLKKPEKDEIPASLAKTIIGQGHLCPFSLNALPVHWDFDYALRLYPLPDLVVIGDKAEPYRSSYKGCQVINPGMFCENGYQFMAYSPSSNEVEECEL